MKKNWLLIVGGVLLVTATLIVINSARTKPVEQVADNGSSDNHNHSGPTTPAFDPKRVPAHFEQPPNLTSLGPTLAPERFIGKTREAYKVVKEIPQTIAQLPCYCHCDRGYGHKSLYSCFEDDHAAHCAVCVDEALLAYQLTKKDKLSPEEIRKRIVAQYTP
jgi:hypothetical protein